MSVKCKLHDKETVLTKGALDVLLNRCIKIRKNNQVREISQSDIDEILKVNEKFSNQGLRVLSFAYKEADEDLTIENEKDFIFLVFIIRKMHQSNGQSSFIDPKLTKTV